MFVLYYNYLNCFRQLFRLQVCRLQGGIGQDKYADNWAKSGWQQPRTKRTMVNVNMIFAQARKRAYVSRTNRIGGARTASSVPAGSRKKALTQVAEATTSERANNPPKYTLLARRTFGGLGHEVTGVSLRDNTFLPSKRTVQLLENANVCSDDFSRFWSQNDWSRHYQSGLDHFP